MDTNATTTVTITLAPSPPVAAPSFTGSHILLDHNWLVSLRGKQYGIWQARGHDGCILMLGDQTAAIPMTAPTFIAVTSSVALAIGFVLVLAAKLYKPGWKQI